MCSAGPRCARAQDGCAAELNIGRAGGGRNIVLETLTTNEVCTGKWMRAAQMGLKMGCIHAGGRCGDLRLLRGRRQGIQLPFLRVQRRKVRAAAERARGPVHDAARRARGVWGHRVELLVAQAHGLVPLGGVQGLQGPAQGVQAQGEHRGALGVGVGRLLAAAGGLGVRSLRHEGVRCAIRA